MPRKKCTNYMCRKCKPNALAYILLAALVLIVSVRARERFTIEQTAPVRAFDGMSYRVHKQHSDYQEAADMLAALNSRTTDIVRFLRRRYIGAPGVPPTSGRLTPARVDAVRNLLRRYNPDNLAENSPHDVTGDSSYCLDKGAVIALCLRQRRADAKKPLGAIGAIGGAISGAINGTDYTVVDKLHDIDTLLFVTLHELAHTAIDDVDHPPKFWSTFKFLLDEARIGGMYQSPNFAARPINYCGVHVSYNPQYDNALLSI